MLTASPEINIEKTKKLLSKHAQRSLGSRALRRLRGEYPSRAKRKALRLHEKENRKPHEKIKDSIIKSSTYTARHNSTMSLYALGAGRVKTAAKKDKYIVATEAMPFEDLESNKLVADLCAAGGNPSLIEDPELTQQGFYADRKTTDGNEIIGIYLSDESMLKVEKVPFDETAFAALNDELQKATVLEAERFADHAQHRVMSRPIINFS